MVIQSVESVLNQSYSNIEIIVVDDSSTDNTKKILSKYLELDNFVYFRNEQNLGACASRNIAIKVAKGGLITGLDDDDLFMPERIKELVDTFNKKKTSCVTASITERTSIGDIDRSFECGNISLDKLLHHNSLGNQVLTKTAYLREIGGFDQSMPAFQDYDTWVRLVDKFGPAYKIKSCSYLWQTAHEGDRISTNTNNVQKGFRVFYNKHHNKMTPAHINTYQILEMRIFYKSFSTIKCIRLVRSYNWKQALTLILERNFPIFNTFLHKLRTK